jgi:ribonuclease D
MTNFVHKGDLPAGLDLGPVVAVDSETMGLNPHRDQLCIAQFSAGNGDAHVVQLDLRTYDAPRIKTLLADPGVVKIMHFARFDLGMFMKWLETDVTSVYCTRIASRLARTYAPKHSLKEILKELLGVDLSKFQQSSDWGAEVLTEAQIDYAAADVLYLHALKERLDEMLARHGRSALAEACFQFLPVRVALDLAGWPDVDIFSYG